MGPYGGPLSVGAGIVDAMSSSSSSSVHDVPFRTIQCRTDAPLIRTRHREDGRYCCSFAAAVSRRSAALSRSATSHANARPDSRGALRCRAGGIENSLTSGGDDASLRSKGSRARGERDHLDPDASYTYKQLRGLFSVEQLKDELTARDLPYLGYKSQLAGRLYQALLDEGRALLGEEAARVDEELELEVGDVEDAQGDNPSLTGVLLEDDSESILSNKTGMQVTFLSTLKAPNGVRIASSVALRTLQSVILFDVGEDTQRSLIGHTLVDWKRIDRIFISSMDPESVLGLPGMLCTISASRSKGHEAADVPVHVYGPPGLVQFVSSMLAVSRTYLEMPVVLHELTPGRVEEGDMVAKEVLKRSRLYACKLPPDALNKMGYYDGELKSMLKRSGKGSGNSKASDLRAGTLPQQLPRPGDPSRKDVAVSQMVWTIRVDSEWVMKVCPLKNTVPTFAFKAVESDRSGRLFPAIAKAMGIFDSKQFSELKSGRSVVSDSGEEVSPDACVGPKRRGRTFGIVPPCLDSRLFARNMGHVDVLIHSMTTLTDDKCLVKLGKEARACAEAAKAKELVLWQAQTSFLDLQESTSEDFVDEIMSDAKGDAHNADDESDSGGVEIVLGGTYCAHQWTKDLGCTSSDDETPLLVPDELVHLL
jgi:ribonuclease Z